MGYPEKLLANDEKVVDHLHPHWITLVPATLWFIVFCAAAGAGVYFAPNSGTGRTVVLILIAVAWLVLVSWLSFSPWIRWRTTHYLFTTHRVLIRRGVLHHTGRDISLQRISDVAFSQTLWDRMVRAGTLTIESAGEHG
ncbi:MAG: PH domain-containing protein, partial [Jatrophihabitans sp.]